MTRVIAAPSQPVLRVGMAIETGGRPCRSVTEKRTYRERTSQHERSMMIEQGAEETTEQGISRRGRVTTAERETDS